MGETIDTAPEQRRAVLVAVVRERQDERQANEYLDELEFLAETADIRSVKRFTQRLPQPSSRIYVGPGKLEEIAGYCKENGIDVVTSCPLRRRATSRRRCPAVCWTARV